ncbi:transcription factor bHLH67-like isoform X2 [Hibiscus syriacus]|uniref:transcription factor bHLH67-like isoform X2 n=1 Tax=Hibiscus syriacus TaxID=106335 RepID=UPI00192155A0|nr:transcription factor bHLH67-like isoform X2 [Hibiscus syriacus]XP_039047925.1 transcription factor bHLH67-like isoform X2 [Hibiscus syriacus]
MESLQEPISSRFIGDQLDVECLEQGFVNSELLSFGREEEEEKETQYTIFSLKNKMPFLQMLQSVELEPPQLFAFKNPSFQTLLRLQHLNNDPFMETQIQALELESCVTREALDLHSPVKSETNNDLKNNPHFSSSCFDVVSSEFNQNADNCSKNVTKSTLVPRERRKRKRTKPVKNKDEVESQRMTHIAVERNRRRQMNDYLNSLRSLMPPSYIQRVYQSNPTNIFNPQVSCLVSLSLPCFPFLGLQGDQASIIGGAIDFVKELEQLVQSMEAQKRMRTTEESNNNSSSNNSESKSAIEISQPEVVKGEAEIEVNVVHNHVNLKIQCERRPGQLVQGIVTLESLRLTVLHLNITSLQASVLYSFNLKMEDDCKLRSADEISATVHQIFS